MVKKILLVIFKVIEAILAVCGLLGILISMVYSDEANRWSKELGKELIKDYDEWKHRKYTKVI